MVNDDQLFRPRALPPGMVVAAFTVEALLRQDAMHLDFMTHGLPLAYSLEIAHGVHRAVISAPPFGEAKTRLTSGIANGTAQP